MAGKMNLNNMKVPKMPDGRGAYALLRIGAVLGIGLYAAGNSLYNVEGGHRAIVFNRIVGVKDKVYFICSSYRAFLCFRLHKIYMMARYNLALNV